MNLMLTYLDESSNKVYLFHRGCFQLFQILDRYHQPLSERAGDVEEAAVRL